MNDHVFESSHWFKNWFIGRFRVWPRLYLGVQSGMKISLFDGGLKHCITHLYGLSIGRIFIGSFVVGDQHPK